MFMWLTTAVLGGLELSLQHLRSPLCGVMHSVPSAFFYLAQCFRFTQDISRASFLMAEEHPLHECAPLVYTFIN